MPIPGGADPDVDARTMADEDESKEDGTFEEDGTLLVDWQGGVILFPGGCLRFAIAMKASAVRTHYKTGDIEMLERDGRTWRKLGRPMETVK